MAQSTNMSGESPEYDILARQVRIDNSDPRAPKVVWRVASILGEGIDSVRVGEEFSETVTLRPSEGSRGMQTDPKLLVIFHVSSGVSASRFSYRYSIFTDESSQMTESIIEREKAGVSDVRRLKAFGSDLERAAAFAKTAKEGNLPSIELMLEGIGISDRNRESADVRLAISDGLSVLATRQDIPAYVLSAALVRLEDVSVGDEKKERAREVQIMLRLLDAFHRSSDTPDRSRVAERLLGEIEMRAKWSWLRIMPELNKPFEQLFQDMDVFKRSLSTNGKVTELQRVQEVVKRFRERFDEKGP